MTIAAPSLESRMGRCPSLLVTCRVAELRRHPSYVRHGITVTAAQISSLAALEPPALLSDPLHITRDRIVIDGYARWQFAKQRGMETLPCVEHDLTEQEALLHLIQRHQQLQGLNNFNRIVLALDLESFLRERARINQQLGGQHKLSSNLAKADRIDVRQQVAKAAGASEANVGKVKDLLASAKPEVLEALRSGELRIHRAWCWLKKPEKQLVELMLHRDQRGINRTISTLLQKHQSSAEQPSLDLQRIAVALGSMPVSQRKTVIVREVKVSGEVLLLSPSLRELLTKQGTLPL